MTGCPGRGKPKGESVRRPIEGPTNTYFLGSKSSAFTWNFLVVYEKFNSGVFRVISSGIVGYPNLNFFTERPEG